MRSEAVYSTPIVRNYDHTNHYSTIGTAKPTSPVQLFQVSNYRLKTLNSFHVSARLLPGLFI